jgi:hypothetical protein
LVSLGADSARSHRCICRILASAIAVNRVEWDDKLRDRVIAIQSPSVPSAQLPISGWTKGHERGALYQEGSVRSDRAYSFTTATGRHK